MDPKIESVWSGTILGFILVCVNIYILMNARPYLSMLHGGGQWNTQWVQKRFTTSSFFHHFLVTFSHIKTINNKPNIHFPSLTNLHSGQPKQNLRDVHNVIKTNNNQNLIWISSEDTFRCGLKDPTPPFTLFSHKNLPWLHFALRPSCGAELQQCLLVWNFHHLKLGSVESESEWSLAS